jgi:general secretion pathway protein F
MTAAVTLDDLTALSAEIGALVRAGVPLEQGLAELGGDLPGRLGRLATTLAERTSRGEPLADVVAGQTADLPPAYRAVVEAGLRAGRLPAALEAVAAAARRMAETQRTVAVAVAYPLLVFVVAWGALACLATVLAPRLAASFSAAGSPGGGFLGFIAWLGRGAIYWGPTAPLGVVLLALIWWRAARRATTMHAGRSARLLGWLPWLGRMLRWSRTATFLEILALLVENEAPSHEAVLLAARACGDLDTLRGAGQLAAMLEQGQSGAGGAGVSPVAFPPLIQWLMLAAPRNGALLPALKCAAEGYRRRTLRQADVIRVFLPVVLTVVIAGSITLAYALTVFAPYAAMLHFLGRAF